MFIKASSFKKMIKAAAGTGDGLHVKNDGGEIWITAPRWRIWIPKRNIPNQQLGDMIALMGWLPEAGEAFTVHKGGELQMEMTETIESSAYDQYQRCDTEYFATRTLVNDDGWCRLLQADDYRNNPPVCVPEDLYGMINLDAIDADGGEDLPEGPRCCRKSVGEFYENGVCFMNSFMAFSITPRVLNCMGKEVDYMNLQRKLRVDEREIDPAEQE